MKAEERLERHQHAITVWDGHEIAKNQKYTIEACEAYDLAREAIALLREQYESELPHWIPGDPPPKCTCGACVYQRRVRIYLEGEDGK